MGLSISENFDGVVAPALPSGWTFNAKYATSASQARSSPNGLTLSGATSNTRYFGFYNTPDTTSNSWTVSCAFWINGTGGIVGAGAVFGASTTDPTTNSMYFVQPVNPPTGSKRVRFFKQVSGTPTSVADVVLVAGWTAANWYVLTVTGSYSAPNTSVSVQVQDTSTGNYLDSSGNFVAGVATCLTAVDGSTIAPGYYGVAEVSGSSGGDVFLDNFTLSSVVADPVFPLAFPAEARGARRSSPDTYRGLIVRPPMDQGIAADPYFPNAFPEVARGPRRAPNTAYVPVVTARSPVDAGAVQDPYFALAYPPSARPPARASQAAYVGLASPPPLDAGNVQQPCFVQLFPHLARAASRSSPMAYAGLLAPTPVDLGNAFVWMPRPVVVQLPKEFWLEDFRQ